MASRFVLLAFLSLLRHPAGSRHGDQANIAIALASQAYMAFAARFQYDAAAEDALNSSDDFGDSLKQEVIVHVYQAMGKRCIERKPAKPGFFMLKGESATFDNCADKCLQVPACERVTLWTALFGSSHECRGCAANEVEDKLGWKYYEKQTVEPAREHLQVQVRAHEEKKQALEAFARTHLKHFAKEEKKIADALKKTLGDLKNKTVNYAITPIGTLVESGANDAVMAFWFDPQKAPATKSKGRPSKKSAATPEEVPFKGAAVYKKTSKAKFGEAQTLSEMSLTRKMSESCGLSVGFAGGFSTKNSVYMLTEYRPSRNFYILYTADLLSGYTGSPEDQTKIQLFVLGQLLFILKQLKEQLIVHRDFKGENLVFPNECWDLFTTNLPATELIETLVRHGCAITLIDYGLACTMETKGIVRCATNTTGVGTRGYRSNDAMEGLYDYKSDLYGMGATAVDVFTASSWPPGNKGKDGAADLTEVKTLLADVVADQVADIIIQMVTQPMTDINKVDELWGQIPQDVQHAVEDLSQGLLTERRGRKYLV